MNKTWITNRRSINKQQSMNNGSVREDVHRWNDRRFSENECHLNCSTKETILPIDWHFALKQFGTIYPVMKMNKTIEREIKF